MEERPVFITAREAAGMLKRAMPGRDAAAWLEADRRYAPLLPPVVREGEIHYIEADVIALARRLEPGFRARSGKERRVRGERRRLARDRRQRGERRAGLRALEGRPDRRLMIRPDRRADLDRRIRGWVDRRCIPDRRQGGT